MPCPLKCVPETKYPVFKIIGTNDALKSFLAECEHRKIPTPKHSNSFFRDDYEHCLMPCYAYNKSKPDNILLQTLSADVYETETIYDLATDFDKAMAVVIDVYETKNEAYHLDKIQKLEKWVKHEYLMQNNYKLN